MLDRLVKDLDSDPPNDDDVVSHFRDILIDLKSQPVQGWGATLEQVVERLWYDIHSGYYMDVPISLRKAFCILSELLAGSGDDKSQSFFLLDRGDIINGSSQRTVASAGASYIHAAENPLLYDEPCNGVDSRSMIPVVTLVSLNDWRDHVECKTPFVVKGVCNRWKALSKWSSTRFWEDLFNNRVVPVKIGNYLSEDFHQGLISIGDFIKSLQQVSQDSGLVYLAQYDLFNRFPDLQEDLLPLLPGLMLADELPERYVFFGPAGTVTPLHTDPQDNFLCQVVGSKYVRLHHPDDSPLLYVNGNPLTRNSTLLPADLTTSVEEIAQYFPTYLKSRIYETVLYPGDMLFIPRLWWHFVKSKSISISVASFIHI